MPVYEYKCQFCGNTFEKLQNKSIPHKTELCKKCGKKAKKIISLSNFVLNGYSEKNGYSKKE